MTDKYHMSSHKLLWHLERLEDWQKGGKISPMHIQLGITTGCNLDCCFCYGKEFGQTSWKDRREMPKKTIIDLFRESKESGIKSITIIGEGENTTHLDFYDIIDYAREIDLDLGLATNGIAIRKNSMSNFLRSFVWIRTSLCAAERSRYKEIHGKDRFHQVISNIESLVTVKKRNNLDTTLGLQMVVLPENIDQILPLTKLGKDLGADYFVVKPCADTPEKKFGIPFATLKNLDELLVEAENHSTEDYAVIVKFDKFQSGDIHPYITCYDT